MVDALHSAWKVLRPRGLVVDLQPAVDYTPLVAIVSGAHRKRLGQITRRRDEGVDAAHRARHRAVADSAFSLVVSAHGAHRTLYRSLADLRWLLRQNENWRIPAPLWRRIAAAWKRRPEGAEIEVRRAFSLAVLRKRG
jgi:hypothetical protein